MLVITVKTPLGCTGSDSVYVWMNYPDVMSIANAFSPGSPGNGAFRVLHVNSGFTLRSFRIYDRWGIKLFETGNINEGGDGTFHGTAQPYVYVLEAGSARVKSTMQHGTVTLLR